MMGTLLSKDVLYEPIKELHDRVGRLFTLCCAVLCVCSCAHVCKLPH
jgi:hypothetical protein